MNRQRAKAVSSTESESLPWSPGRRAIASLLVFLHLLAVVLPPLNFATQGSPAVRPLFVLTEPYIDAAYLNHGYAFFAPNPPGANSLLRYRVEFDDGRPPIVGVLPDREAQWPRLYYHRHFMLSEQLSAKETPPVAPPDVDPRHWKAQNAAYRKAWNSFQNHLLHKHGGSRVSMEFYDHRPPGIFEGQAGKPLNADDLYRPRSDRWREEESP